MMNLELQKQIQSADTSLLMILREAFLLIAPPVVSRVVWPQTARAGLIRFQELSSDDRESLLTGIERAKQDYQDAADHEKELNIICENVTSILMDSVVKNIDSLKFVIE